jgi:hypothetical protein
MPRHTGHSCLECRRVSAFGSHGVRYAVPGQNRTGRELAAQGAVFAQQEAYALLEFYEAVAEEKQIHLKLKGDGLVDGDRLMFHRAVSNLLSNALRYAACRHGHHRH